MTDIPVSQQGKNWVFIKIADNGPGIPEEIRDKIFTPFLQRKLQLEELGSDYLLLPPSFEKMIGFFELKATKRVRFSI